MVRMEMSNEHSREIRDRQCTNALVERRLGASYDAWTNVYQIGSTAHDNGGCRTRSIGIWPRCAGSQEHDLRLSHPRYRRGPSSLYRMPRDDGNAQQRGAKQWSYAKHNC